MTFDRLHALLEAMFAQVNIANQPPEPSTLWDTYGSEITPLLASSTVRDEFVALGDGVWLPRSIEATRVLGQLRQRFAPADGGRPLVGRIRAETIVRQRPSRTVARDTLRGASRVIAELTSHQFTHFTDFQVDGWSRVLTTLKASGSLIITAPTGSGKTEVFLLPLIYDIARALAAKAASVPRYVLLYPRVALLKDQLIRVFRAVASAQQHILQERGATTLSHEHAIIIGM